MSAIDSDLLAALPLPSFLALLDACPAHPATELDAAARRLGVQRGDDAPYWYGLPGQARPTAPSVLADRRPRPPAELVGDGGEEVVPVERGPFRVGRAGRVPIAGPGGALGAIEAGPSVPAMVQPTGGPVARQLGLGWEL